MAAEPFAIEDARRERIAANHEAVLGAIATGDPTCARQLGIVLEELYVLAQGRPGPDPFVLEWCWLKKVIETRAATCPEEIQTALLEARLGLTAAIFGCGGAERPAKRRRAM